VGEKMVCVIEILITRVRGPKECDKRGDSRSGVDASSISRGATVDSRQKNRGTARPQLPPVLHPSPHGPGSPQQDRGRAVGGARRPRLGRARQYLFRHRRARKPRQRHHLEAPCWLKASTAGTVRSAKKAGRRACKRACKKA